MAVIAVFGLLSVIISYLTIEANGYPYLNNSTRTLIKNQVSDSAYIYKYSTVVLVGQNEPKEFASKLYLQGKLIIKPQANHDSKTDWYIKFQDVVHTIHNGPNNNGIDESEYRILENHLKEFETPFLLIIDSDTSGFKIQQHESLWSRNMKKAILSLMNFDVDLTNLNTKKLQNTIYGDCEVNYSFNEVTGTKMFLRAVYEPRKCSKYVQHVTSDERSTSCHVKKEEDLMTSVENLYELNINLNEIPNLPLLLKKIVSHEKAAYLPWLHRSSGVQYVDIKQTVEFEMLANASEVNLPQIDFEKVPIMSDLSFESTENLDFMLISKNLTQSDFIQKVQDYLSMMANYLKNNHFEVNNYPHKNLLKKLTQTMRYLNTESIEAIFEDVQKKVEKTRSHESFGHIFRRLSNENLTDESILYSGAIRFRYTNQGDCQVLYNGTMTLNEEKISLVKSYKPEECKNFVNTYAGYYPESEDAEEYIKVSWNFRCPPSLYDDIIGGISSIDSLYKKMSGMYMDVWINSPDWINTKSFDHCTNHFDAISKALINKRHNE
ncbi:unnamed protein product [Trichogramma brassicae]|uniref:Vitellogenin domain-containing protein n=1 Tax=Trichogramma brassicae TaxID=86971 RepID=A0A6H5J8T3_9HYME|nr:unnamed protein product [Trichogramma brassicae]